MLTCPGRLFCTFSDDVDVPDAAVLPRSSLDGHLPLQLVNLKQGRRLRRTGHLPPPHWTTVACLLKVRK